MHISTMKVKCFNKSLEILLLSAGNDRSSRIYRKRVIQYTLQLAQAYHAYSILP